MFRVLFSFLRYKAEDWDYEARFWYEGLFYFFLGSGNTDLDLPF